ncbi:MraY family glycosyltransferase [Streptomyces kebangsaanensis]|uniref:MraY family glycosyltransferase n=1 Tax=Streptomyces kebangsaanensis TaxID=864058 RepID=UPI00093C4F0E|nr:MraY family glycosyltransferase [Streptomyces kebangsaanensis]
MLYGIATAITALLLAAVLSALLRGPALRLGLVDRRRVRPVPLLGGVAVVLSTCLVVAAGGWTGAAPLGDGVVRLLAASAGVAVLGLVADLWRLRTPFLLVGTAVAAAFVVPYDETGLPAGIAAVAWIACVAAAFRGLDHADGLAGTVGVLTAFGAGACAAAEVMDDLVVLLSVLAAALTGFLMHNWHPARIAFGASGSLFTGFLLASAAVLTRTGYAPLPTAAVLFALTATASADAVLVVLSRKLAGRPVLRRGPDHLAHRLRRLGPTPPGVTVLLGAGTFAAVLVGVLVHSGWAAPRSVLWVAGASLVVALGLLRVPAYGPRRPAGPHGARAHTDPRGTRAPARVPGTRGLPAARGVTRARTEPSGAARGAARARTEPPGGAPRARAGLSGGPTRTRADVPGTRSRSEQPFWAGRSRARSDVYDHDHDYDHGHEHDYDVPARADAPGSGPVRGAREGLRDGWPYGAEAPVRAPRAPRRQPPYPAPPPQKSASPQVRAFLRIRDG